MKEHVSDEGVILSVSNEVPSASVLSRTHVRTLTVRRTSVRYATYGTVRYEAYGNLITLLQKERRWLNMKGRKKMRL